MLSALHEALAEMVRHRPTMVPEVLTTLFRLDIPAWDTVQTISGDLTETKPAGFHVDVPTLLTSSDGTRQLVVGTEVQLSRDPRKRYTWPHYLTSLRTTYECPAMLLIICVDPHIARWCAQTIDTGHPGFHLPPLVLGPAQVPTITDPAQAQRHPELTVLSAIAHGSDPAPEPVFRALLTGLQTIDRQHADLYTDTVLGTLPQAARRCLEALMDLKTYEPQSEYFRRWGDRRAAEGKAQGVAEGKAATVLEVLSVRGITVPPVGRAQITGCTDLDQLDTWARRAVTATTLDEVLD